MEIIQFIAGREQRRGHHIGLLIHTESATTSGDKIARAGVVHGRRLAQGRHEVPCTDHRGEGADRRRRQLEKRSVR